jgi:hypothetical protein
MRLFLLSVLATIAYAGTVNVPESNGVYFVNDMTVYNLYAGSNGFAQIDKTPAACGTVHLLNAQGKNIGSSYKGLGNMNVKVEKGRLKLMVTPEEQCKVSFSMPD